MFDTELLSKLIALNIVTFDWSINFIEIVFKRKVILTKV